jgi:PAS domain S-box-containing protein
MTAGKKRLEEKTPETVAAGHSLREVAVERLDHTRKHSSGFTGQAPEELIYELQVHQIELEMQAEELRRARLALEESRDKYLDLFDFAPLGYLTLNEKGIITDANLTGALLLGIDRNKLVNTRFRKLVLENESDQWLRYFANVMSHDGKKTGTLTLIRGNGSTFPARLESIRIPGRSGGTATIRIALNDITDIRKTEDALRESEEKYRGLFAAKSDGIVVVDRKTGIMIDCNDSFPGMYDLRRDEVVGQPYSAIAVKPDTTRASQKKVPGYAPDMYHQRKDGSVFPVEITASVLCSQGRDVMIAAVRDITDRKQADAFRQLSTEVLSILNEPAELNVTVRRVLHAIRQTTNADAAAIRLRAGNVFPYFVQVGFSDEFLQKENALETGDQPGGFDLNSKGFVIPECICGQVISGKTDPSNPLFTPGGSAWINNTTLLRELSGTDETRFCQRNTCINLGYASIAVIPIREGSQQIIGTLQVNTLRKGGFNADIIQSLELIAGQIGEAMMRRQAEEALHQALAEKGILLSEVHHRVKNNLQIISGLLDMTRMRTADQATSGILTDVMLKIKTMAQIHTRLYESKQFDRINIGGQIRDQVEDLSSVYLRSGPEILCTIDSEDIYLSVDRAIPLALAVNEVLSNAFKHAFHGRRSGNIRVSVKQDRENIHVCIGDDGIGVPEGIDIYQSASLGLKLIRNLVQQLQGSLKIESSVKGFVVEIDFPLVAGGK